MVHAEVVDPGPGNCLCVLSKVRYAGTGHLERQHLTLDGFHHPRRIDLQRSRHQISVEEVVEVLICRHSFHDSVALSVGQCLPGVVVGDSGRQLLEGEIDKRVGDGRYLRGNAASDLGHPGTLQVDRVDVPAHD